MDLLEAHDRDRRAEGARGFWVSLVMLLGTLGVGFALVGSHTVTTTASATPTPTRSDVAALEHRVDDQSREISQLRSLLDACLAGDRLCAQSTSNSPNTLWQTPPTSVERRVTVKDEQVTVKRATTEPEPVKQKPAPAPDVVSETADTVKQAVQGVLDTARKVSTR